MGQQKATPGLGLATVRKRRVSVGFQKIMSVFSCPLVGKTRAFSPLHASTPALAKNFPCKDEGLRPFPIRKIWCFKLRTAELGLSLLDHFNKTWQ
jgi:hypothetical protein